MLWRQKVCGTLLLLLALVPQPAMADQWIPAAPATYESPDHATRLRVLPRVLASSFNYFEDKVARREPAGGVHGDRQEAARGILERKNEAGQWTVVWDKPLVNDVAPVSALVADGGSYVVTFDNWHSMGWGEDVVVIYGSDGHLIRKLALKDFLPDYYVEALPHSVSSVWWGGEHRLSPAGQEVTLQVVVPDSGSISGKHRYVLRAIRTADGSVIENASADWQNALADARKVADTNRLAYDERRRFMTEPLFGPNPPSEPGWFQYMREAFFRLDPDWQEGSADQTVLRSPTAADYQPSVEWLADSLTLKDALGSTAMIATLAPPEHLLSIMEGILGKGRPGKLKGTLFYIIVPAAYQERLRAMFAISGAQVICLDPTAPISIPPERLKWRQEP